MSAISKLQDAEIKLLSAAQVCTDPCSVLKELVENALDAQATRVSMLLDGYGLDSIQVKDNGTGISADSRDKVARRHCTSKLTSFSQLTSVSTYGFRGEALASLADISKSLLITTRTQRDSVATCYERNSRGQLKAIKTCGDAVGTTVTAIKCFSDLPVRREKLKKEASKSVASIKELVLSYALIHPTVRFHLSVKSGKRGESPVVTTHAPVASLQAAVERSFGKAAADACLFQSKVYPLMTISAGLPAQNTAPSATAIKGQFFYVEGRPLSILRGMPKKITSLVREHISKNTSVTISKPFFLLNLTNITCEYDVNLEPSKNAVFFCDADAVLQTITDFLEWVYDKNDRDLVRPSQSNAEFTSPAMEPPSTEMQLELSAPQRPSQRRSSWMQSMNGFPISDEDQELVVAQDGDAMDEGVQDEDFVSETEVQTLTTPWTIAALSASGRSTTHCSTTQKRTSSNHATQECEPYSRAMPSQSSPPESRSVSPVAKRRRVAASRTRRTEPQQSRQQNDILSYLKPRPTVSLVRDDADLPDRAGRLTHGSPVRASRLAYTPRVSQQADASDQNNYLGASPSRQSLVRSGQHHSTEWQRRQAMERTHPDGHCHDLSIMLQSCIDDEDDTHNVFGHAETSFKGIQPSGVSLDQLNKLTDLTYLGGGLCLLVGSSADKVLALFVTPRQGALERVEQHKQSDFTELRRMGDADQLVRIW